MPACAAASGRHGWGPAWPAVPRGCTRRQAGLQGQGVAAGEVPCQSIGGLTRVVAGRHGCKEQAASQVVAGAMSSSSPGSKPCPLPRSSLERAEASTLESQTSAQLDRQQATATSTGSVASSRCRRSGHQARVKQQAHLEQAVVEDGRLPALLGVLGGVRQAPQVSAASVALQARLRSSQGCVKCQNAQGQRALMSIKGFPRMLATMVNTLSLK